MEILNNVSTVKQVSSSEFWTDYVLQGRPVVVDGLFDRFPIAALRTSAAALEMLGDLPVVVKEEATASYFAGRKFGGGTPEQMTLAAYAASLPGGVGSGARQRGTYAPSHANVPVTLKVISELEAPARLRALYEAPAICRNPVEPHSFSMAGAGAFEHLHYDVLPTHSLVYQVFGRKRFVFVPTMAASKSNWILNQGTALLANMTESDKVAYLRYLGAYDCVVGAGQALLVPMVSWHYAEYLETSLSCSIRFGENERARRLIDRLGGRRTIHRNPWLQTICAALTNEAAVDQHLDATLGELDDTLVASAVEPDPMQCYDRRQQALEAVYTKLAPEAAASAKHHYFPVTRYMRDLIGQLLAHPELL